MINVAILTVSDRSFLGERFDLSGPALCSEVQRLGWQVVASAVVPDEFDQIKEFLINHSKSEKVDLILTTGGTGFAPRDVTPEATKSVIERQASGLMEFLRNESSKINPHACLSRGEAGIANRCLIINLPGSPKGAVESLSIIAPILPHGLDLLSGAKMDESQHNFHPLL